MGPVGKAEGWRDMPDGVAARRSVNGRSRCPDPFSPFRSFEKLRDGQIRCPVPSFLRNPGTTMRAAPASGTERRAEPAEIVGGISRRPASRNSVSRIAVPRFCKSLPIRPRFCRFANSFADLRTVLPTRRRSCRSARSPTKSLSGSPVTAVEFSAATRKCPRQADEACAPPGGIFRGHLRRHIQ